MRLVGSLDDIFLNRYVGGGASFEEGACGLADGGFQLVVVQRLGAVDEEVVQLCIAEAKQPLLGV